MRTTRRRITQSRGAQCVAGATFLFAIALFIPGVTQRFNTAVTWRPAGPFFSPAGQVKFDHSGNATMEEAPAEEAAAAATEGGQEGGHIEEQINLSAMSEEQLADALMWWQSSQKIDSPPGDPLYPPPERESYITWEPDIGGLNNIRLQMEMLVILTHLTGRTLVLPDHLASDIYMMRQPVSLWDYYDFEHLRQWIPAISMNQYLDIRNVAGEDAVRTDPNALRDYLRDSSRHTETAYPKWNSINQVLAPGGDGSNQEDPTGSHPRLAEWRVMHANPAELREEVFYGDEERNALTLHFESSDQTRLFGSPAFIYLPTAAWLDYYWAKVRDYLHFQPDRLREAARVLARVFQETGGRFNAMHVRSTDWAIQYPEWYVQPENAAPTALKVLGGETAVYIATDDDNRTALEPLIKAFPQVIFMADMVSEEDVPYNARGVVDQLVCSLAGRFLGTFGSTFSAYISRMRAYHSAALVPDKGVYFTNYPDTLDAYDNAMNNNDWQANSVWWSRPGVEQFNRELWMRDFVVTTDFTSLRPSQPDGQPVEGQGEQVTEGQPVDGQFAEEQPAQGRPAEEQPVEGQPVEAQPVEEQPAEVQPAEGQPVEGQPVEGQPAEGQPAKGQLVEGQPAEGQEGQPAEGGEPQQPAPEGEGQPAEGQPAEGQAAEGQSAEGQPAEGGQEGQPAEGQPVEGQPAEGQDGQPQPEGQPAEGQEGHLQLDGQPQAEGQPQDGQPQEGQDGQLQAEGQPQEGQPQEGQPQEGLPQEGQPQEGQPAEGQEGQLAEGTEGQPQEGQPVEGQGAQPAEGTEGQPQEGQPAEKQEGQPQEGQPQPEGQPVEGQEGQPQPEGQPDEGQPAEGQQVLADGQPQADGEQLNPEGQPQNPEGGEPQPEALQVEGQEGGTPDGQMVQARLARLSRALRSILSL